MELKRVRIDQIFPDENNPRKEFRGIEELARSLMANEADPGQPINPIVTVRDGDGYRIFDGERRYQAAKLNGTEELEVIVFGDYQEAQSAFGMLASDNKERLTDQERSQAVQHCLQLGLKPTTVDDIAGLKKGQASKIKKARKALGDAAAQCTIDQLLAASSLKDSGATAEEVERVLSAEPEDWETFADAARARIRKEEFRAAAAKLLSEHGLELSEEVPEETAYKSMYSKLEKLEEALREGVPEGSAFIMYGDTRPSVDLYVPLSSVDDEDDPFAKQKDELAATLQAAEASRACFYLEALCPPHGKRSGRSKATPNIDAYLCRYVEVDGATNSFLAACNLEKIPRGIPCPAELSGVAAIYAYWKGRGEPWGYRAKKLLEAHLKGDDIEPISRGGDLGEYVDWIEAFIADGFEMDPAEAEFYELVKANLEPATDADDGISGDGEDESADEEQDVPAAAEEVAQDAPAEPEGGLGQALPDDELALDELLDAAAAELRIADEAAPAGEPASSADDAELDVASLSFDGQAVV